MKRIFTLFAFVALTAVAAIAQDVKTTNPNAPTMVFVTETHDFGDISQGDVVTVDFEFKNTGKTDLILSNVKASCGCTTPYWPKEPIKPGQTSKISATFNSTGKSGPFNKPITITSNTNEATTRIFIKGNINIPKGNDGVPEKAPSLLSN